MQRIRVFCLSILSLFVASNAHAAMIETSVLLSYAKQDLGNGFASRQNRYTGSLAFKFTAVSAIELSYSYSRTKVDQATSLGGLLSRNTSEVIIVDDVVYSISWVQNLVPGKFVFQPYVKVGGGRLIRTQTRELPEFSFKVEQKQSSDTGVAGVGLRIFLTKKMALKGEFITYIPDFKLSRWKESQVLSAGLSWMF